MIFTREEEQEIKDSYLRTKARVRLNQYKLNSHHVNLSKDEISTLCDFIEADKYKVTALERLAESFGIGLS